VPRCVLTCSAPGFCQHCTAPERRGGAAPTSTSNAEMAGLRESDGRECHGRAVAILSSFWSSFAWEDDVWWISLIDQTVVQWWCMLM
jgi:hypothetical protein